MSEIKPTPEEILKKKLKAAFNSESVTTEETDDIVDAISNFIGAETEETVNDAQVAHEDQYDHNQMIYNGGD